MSQRTLIPLTGPQKNELHHLADHPPVAPAFAKTGDANPHLRVFAVHFDGTENDAGHIDEDERATLVAESHRLLSGQRDPNMASRYYQGVGTTKGAFSNKVEAMLGIGCRANAEQAYDDLVAKAQAWLQEDPAAEIHVHVVGFSRGSASALHFMNIVDKLGIKGPLARPAGAVKSSAVLFDTVSTGVTDLDLTLPNSNIATLHLTAGGEERKFFKLTPLEDGRRPSELALAKNVHMEGKQPGADGLLRYQRLSTVELPGARHSDVGGSYRFGGIRELSSFLSREFQRTLGLPVVGVKPSPAMVQAMQANDSRWVKLNNDVESRQQAVREEINVAPRSWDGCYTESCSFRSGADGATMSDNVRAVRSTAQDQARGINEAVLGRKFRAEWSVRPDPVSGEMAIKVDVDEATRKVLAFDKESGSLMLHGVAVQGAPTFKQLVDELRRTGRVSVEIGIERGMMPFDAHQAPGVSTERRAKTQELWPDEFLSTILEVNASEVSQMTGQTASAAMFRCMKAAADAIQQNFSEVGSVRFGGGEGVDGKYTITCLRKDGRVFRHDSESADEVEYAMAVHLRSMREGLMCVGAAIKDECGFEVDTGRHTFGATPAAVGAPLLRGSLLASAGAGGAPFMRDDGPSDEAPAPRRLRLVGR
jgi:hypothetical protein